MQPISVYGYKVEVRLSEANAASPINFPVRFGETHLRISGNHEGNGCGASGRMPIYSNRA